MGPSMIADGKHSAARGGRQIDLASMGPSMIVNGKVLVQRASDWLAMASMGPSMIVDGKSRSPRSAAGASTCFNGAVDDRRRKVQMRPEARRAITALQWGRR